MLDPKAAKNPVQLKDNSEVDARATPVTIGTSDTATGTVGTSPRNIKDIITLKNGSKAFTVCVKDTATALKDTFVSTLPTTWIQAKGVTDFNALISTCGFLCSLKIHISNAIVLPTMKWIAVHVRGYGNTFNKCLL